MLNTKHKIPVFEGLSKEGIIGLVHDHKQAKNNGDNARTDMIEEELFDHNLFTLMMTLVAGLHDLAVAAVSLKYPDMNEILRPILLRNEAVADKMGQ